MRALCEFWREQDGQDLVEYSLLIAFVVFGSLALLGLGRDAVAGIWNRSTDNLVAANSAIGG